MTTDERVKYLEHKVKHLEHQLFVVSDILKYSIQMSSAFDNKTTEFFVDQLNDVWKQSVEDWSWREYGQD